MKKGILYLILMVVFLCCACGSQDDTAELEAKGGTELSSILDENEELHEKSSATLMMGFRSAGEGYTYTGEEMEVPFYIGVMDNTECVEVAAMLFLNGEVQPYSYEIDGVQSEEKSVHFFTLEPEETIDFKAHITPITGEEGDTLGLHFVTVFQSDYLPNPDGNTSFGNCGRVSSTTYVPVTMQVDSKNETKANVVETKITDIPEDVIAMYEGLITDGTDNPLDYATYLEIELEDGKNRLYSEDGKLHLTLQRYGGKEVTEKITFFINNEPVKVEDCDYVEIHTTSGKMTVFDVTLDVSEYEEVCSFYAIAVTSGEDYVIQDEIMQSERCLLINK